MKEKTTDVIQTEKALLLAGRLALSARLVTTANAKNLSKRIEDMEDNLNSYDNYILSR